MSKLRRELGLLELVGISVGGIIGSGIFMMPSLTLSTAGLSALLAWILAGVAMTVVALVFAELGSAFGDTGGPYVYARAAFGRTVGFLVGWGYYVSCVLTVSAVTAAFVSYLGFFVPGLVEGQRLTPVGVLAGLAFLWFLTLLNYVGVKYGGLYASATTLLKVFALAIFAAAGLAYPEPSRFNVLEGLDAVSLGLAVSLAVWPYMGFESVTIPVEEVKKPQRDVPLSIILSMGIVTAVYVLIVLSFLSLLDWKSLGLAQGDWGSLANLSSPLSDVARSRGLLAVAVAVMLGAVFSTGGASGVWLLDSGRFPYAFSQAGDLPKVLGKVHDRYGTPHVGLLLSSIVASAVLVLLPLFPAIALLGVMTSIVPYAVSSLGLAVLRGRGDYRPAFRNPFGKLVAYVSFVFSTLVAYWSCWPWTLVGALLTLAVVPVFARVAGVGLRREDLWYFAYLSGLSVVSLLGDPYFEYYNFLPVHPLGVFKTPVDIAVLVVFASAFFFYVARTRR
ncbi:APC family permease [Thermofilum pendens]|uniref:Amino acid permease-associated region n=1 Tax=Thermofilum pendens (strain DSM 2475 / Hrk 5) TaxID=368408 RepID=A1S0Q5_THEPD|nr:APC family permease [Thermofilum pendens]ABL79035.1 amino acid permease-associated region [Thermofilum pendens Hrk 5]